MAASFDPAGLPFLTRRRFLGSAAAGLAASTVAGSGLAGCGGSGGRGGGAAVANGAIQPISASARATRSRDLRRAASDAEFARPLPTLADNGDEARYANRIGSFSKGLPHNSIGEVQSAAYASLITALTSGLPADFEAIQTGGANRLKNPQAGLCFDLETIDAQAITAPPAPRFDSAEAAAEMVELYWMALCRDVHFAAYGTDSTVAAAAAEMTGLVDWKGPKLGGQVTPGTLFRGYSQNDLVGPWLSQFLWLRVPYGALAFDQLARTVPAGQEFLSDYPSFLAMQNGAAVPAQTFDPTRRYIRNLRDLAEWVHNDPLFQAALNACLILLSFGDQALDPGNPYRTSTRQCGFITLGPVMFQALLGEVALRAMKATWFQKWFVHRRLRPEVYAGRVHVHATGLANYPLHPQVLNSQAVQRILTAKGTRLLPQVFPEGSPLHPSYTAGHATVAAATVTLLKAFFDESFPIPGPVIPSADGLTLIPLPAGSNLTVGTELDKLAANIGIGRDAAGVHWYSDYVESARLGEAVAIAFLTELKPGFNETCSFTLRRFDGTQVTI